MCLACEVAEKGVKIIEERVEPKYVGNPTYNSAASSNY